MTAKRWVALAVTLVILAGLGVGGYMAYRYLYQRMTPERCTVIVDEQALEVTTYRSDSAYADARHPNQVSFVRTIAEDLARRDFTMNALAYHPARGLFDPYEFATSEDTLYLLSAQGRPSTALTASLTAVVAFTAFQRAQSEFTGNNRRLPVPLCCVLDEAANICRWPELADVYSYFGSAGIPIMTIWQNPDQGRAAFGETNFGSLFNNANITVYLGGIKDAKFLGEISQLVGQREIVRGSVNIDGTGRRSVNNSIQKENILDVSDLTEWPVGRALLLASQSRAQIVKTLPWTGNRQWADALTQAKAKAREEQRKAA